MGNVRLAMRQYHGLTAWRGERPLVWVKLRDPPRFGLRSHAGFEEDREPVFTPRIARSQVPQHSKEVFSPGGEAIDECSRLDAETFVIGIGRNDETVARAEFQDSIIHPKAKATALDEGRLYMDMTVTGPFSTGPFEPEGNDHEFGVVRKHLPAHALCRCNDRKYCHPSGSFLGRCAARISLATLFGYTSRGADALQPEPWSIGQSSKYSLCSRRTASIVVSRRLR